MSDEIHSQSKYWCLTLNNPTEEEKDKVYGAVASSDGLVTFVIAGSEVGANGTPHLQCYIEFSRRQRLAGCRRWFGPRIHAEIRRGSGLQAYEYCKKEDPNPREEGERSNVNPGQRSDLMLLKNTLDSQCSLKEVAGEHFGSFLRYERSIRSYRNLQRPGRTWKSNVVVYWGGTGSGKTRLATKSTAGLAWIYSSDGWFDGYDGEEDVIFDDFGGHEFKLTYFLKLLDRYPMRVRIKGGFVSWLPKNIYITSNFSPERWYPNASTEHRAALMRRLDVIINIELPPVQTCAVRNPLISWGG